MLQKTPLKLTLQVIILFSFMVVVVACYVQELRTQLTANFWILEPGHMT